MSTHQLLTDPLPRLLLAWMLCITVACQRLRHALTEFGTDPGTPVEKIRADGNDGHTRIDFGGQWLMGRMIVSGYGRELFHRNRHWDVLRAGFPRSNEAPETQRLTLPQGSPPKRPKEPEVWHDAEGLMDSTMGADSPKWKDFAVLVGLPLAGTGPPDAATLLAVQRQGITREVIAELEKPTIGGPLYPPVHALLYSPLGLLEPKTAYHLLQAVSVVLAVLCGWFASVLAGGRLWTPIAATVILLFPGCRSGLDLGQNHVLTLTVVLGGWALQARQRHLAGGAVWGLLAFKPVWGLAFAVVPLLLGRWRFLLGLAASGCGLVLLTLPVVGVQSWLDWLAVGKMATAQYDVNERWIGLSRDLAGIVRRVVIDFNLPEDTRGSPVADRLSWALWGVVLAGTAVVHRLRRHCPEAEGFLFLGAALTCYRFMYYDLLLASVAVVVLLARWRPPSIRDAATSLLGIMLMLLLLCENWWLRMDAYISIAFEIPERRTDPPPAPALSFASDYFHATDTLLLLALWTGLAVKLLRQRRSSSSAAPISVDRMSDSPTSTA